jgi:transglutaminase-like putative cysteine protease
MNERRTTPPSPLGPERIPGQWAYLLAYALALGAALWQHGEPWLTTLLIGSCLPAAFIPGLSYRRLPPLIRGLLQGAILLAAGGWAIHRLRQGVPPDLLLVESLGIVGFAFVLTTRLRDFRYLGLICMVLLFYGAVFPREAFLWLLPAALLILLLLAYRNRTVGLTDDPVAAAAGNAFRRNPGHILLHLALALALGVYLYGLFPAGGATGEGLIPVSFRTERKGHVPPALDRWFRTPHGRSAADAAAIAPEAAPAGRSPQGRHRTEDDAGPALEVGAGGGGEPGKELVMTVRSPMKLYWLCRLYDEYDGHAWRASAAMRRQSMIFGGAKATLALAHIDQEITLHRWPSPVLPAAYRAAQFTPPPGFGDMLDADFDHCRIRDGAPLPPLPFTYKARSTMMIPVEAEIATMAAALDDTWEESLPAAHYRQLPAEAISSRVRALASALTRDAATPLAQATALRDYLRREYPYDLGVTPPPADREAADFFLFELRRGHCEYFANTLAVLARCRGLAARVATGYSPGDYDLLRQVFEVREHHAHAWTQIFIPGEGWLTFDATPPGEVPSRTTPTAFTRLHDPFGDEWRITPPERTTISRATLRAQAGIMPRRGQASGDEDRRETIAAEWLSRIPTDQAELQESLRSLQAATGMAATTSRWQERLATLRANAATFLRRLRHSLHAAGAWLISPRGILVLDLAFIGVVLWFARPIFLAEWRRRRRLRRCRIRFDKLAAAPREAHPHRTIAICYRLAREWLELTGHRRPPGMDLLDYGAALGDADPLLQRDAMTVFQLYSQFAYSGLAPSPADAGLVFAATAALRQRLLHERLKECHVPA